MRARHYELHFTEGTNVLQGTTARWGQMGHDGGPRRQGRGGHGEWEEGLGGEAAGLRRRDSGQGKARG